MDHNNEYNQQLIDIFKRYQDESVGIFEIHREKIPFGFWGGQYGYMPYDYRQNENRAIKLRDNMCILSDRDIKNLKIDFADCCRLCNVAVIEETKEGWKYGSPINYME